MGWGSKGLIIRLLTLSTQKLEGFLGVWGIWVCVGRKNHEKHYKNHPPPQVAPQS